MLIYSIVWIKVTMNLIATNSRKFEMYCKQTERHTDWLTQANRWTQKNKNIKKQKLAIVNTGSPDTDCLYCPVDVEGVTLKGSLLPDNIR